MTGTCHYIQRSLHWPCWLSHEDLGVAKIILYPCVSWLSVLDFSTAPSPVRYCIAIQTLTCWFKVFRTGRRHSKQICLTWFWLLNVSQCAVCLLYLWSLQLGLRANMTLAWTHALAHFCCSSAFRVNFLLSVTQCGGRNQQKVLVVEPVFQPRPVACGLNGNQQNLPL